MGALYSAFATLDAVVFRRLPPRGRQRAHAVAYAVRDRLLPGRTKAREGLDLSPTTHGVRRTGARKALPAVLLADVEGIRSEIDPLFLIHGEVPPEPGHRFYPKRPEAGRAYRELARGLPTDATHMVVGPWLRRGGADLVTIKHLEALVSEGARVVMVLTEDQGSDWLDRVPSAVTVVEAGPTLSRLSRHDGMLVLSRLVIQSGVGVLHVINSKLAWDCLRVYGWSIGRRAKVFCSVYCDDSLPVKGSRMGFAHDYVPYVDAHVTGYLFDNAAYAADLRGLYGLAADKLHVAYAPTAPAGAVPQGRRVLWAGRFDRQKRPDLLLAIASAMPDVGFDVFGAAVMTGADKVRRALGALPNVRLRGSYDGFDSIPHADYGCLLYTSLWDGLPNVLLEAGARGMGVVAPAICGIPELVTDETGWPVTDQDDPLAYAEAIREALADPTRGWALRALVGARHTVEAFGASVRRIPGYVDATSAGARAIAAE